MFNRVPEKVPENVWEALVQSQVMFNRVPERCRRRSAMGGFGAELQQGSEEGEALFGAEPGLVQVNNVPEKVPEKAPGGFGAEPGQVQQGSRKTWCEAKSGSTGSGESSEGLGSFGAEPGQVWEALVQSQVRFQQGSGEGEGCTSQGQVRLTHGKSAEVFPALGFPARFRKICKNKTLRPLGIPPKLILFIYGSVCF